MENPQGLIDLWIFLCLFYSKLLYSFPGWGLGVTTLEQVSIFVIFCFHM